MNKRQEWFLKRLQYIAHIDTVLYAQKKMLEQMWQEEFRTTQDHALDGVGVDLLPYGIEYDDLNTYSINQLTQHIQFYEGGAALIDRERGKFSRRIKNESNDFRLF